MKEPKAPGIVNAKATDEERAYPLVGDALQEGNTRAVGKERVSKREAPRREKTKSGKAHK